MAFVCSGIVEAFWGSGAEGGGSGSCFDLVETSKPYYCHADVVFGRLAIFNFRLRQLVLFGFCSIGGCGPLPFDLLLPLFMLLLLWVSAAALCNLYEPGQNEGVGQGTPKKVA